MTEIDSTNIKQVTNKTKYIFLFGIAFLLIAIGLVLCPSATRLAEGIKRIVTHPSMNDFDSFYWSHEMGASFVQGGLSLIIALSVFYFTKTDIQGAQIANAFMVTGFSFYGKNILNMWFPILGVILYALVTRKKLSTMSTMAVAMTCLGPVFGTLAFFTEALGIGTLMGVIVGVILAIFGGFIAAIFAEYFPQLHKGLLLYNAGMAAGWAAIIINSALKATGFGHPDYPYDNAYVTDKNMQLSILLIIIFAYILIFGLALGGHKNVFKLFTYNSEGGNHIEKFGFATCLVCMGVVGFLVLGYIILVGADINGTTFTAIFAAIGFTANGSTPRTQLPVFLGVAIGALLTGGVMGVVSGEAFLPAALTKLASRGMLMSTIFSCGVAPVTGKYGNKAGFLVGLVHSMVVPSIGPLHGRMLLYNNGLSYGLVTTFTYPIYSKFKSVVK